MDSVGVDIPSGAVTFLFTDVEGSTDLWARDREAMAASLEAHDGLLREVVEAWGGYVFTTAGDSFAVAFSRPSSAVEAALAAQSELGGLAWPGPELRVRMGLHLGEVEERGGDYFGPVVNLTARLEAAGHGGQILVSDQVRSTIGVETTDLGVYRLRGLPDRFRIHQLGTEEYPPLRIVAPGRTNLPAVPTRLIGRNSEVRGVRDALREYRLVTLTSGGGTGKTRLALAVGEAELPHWPDGVFFVDLLSISDGDRVPGAVAETLGLALTNGNETSQVIDYLAGLELLAILDNCEHVIDACAELAEAMLTRSGSSQLLATSRELFDIDGERAIRLAPLGVDESGPAVQLFVERAMAADRAFNPDVDRATVTELCGHLDGLPLAIELAAARCNVMSPTELLEGIAERFELLGGGRRRRARRTLEDTLEWSYDLLDGDEQSVFRHLGVFVGSFDLDAVQTVTERSPGDARDLVDSLIAKSLVIAERFDDSIRFRLLETTAAYAERRLVAAGEAEAARDRHLDHYLGVCAPYDTGILPTTAVVVLSGDKANIRAAVDWAMRTNQWAGAADLLSTCWEILRSQADGFGRAARLCLHSLPDTDHRRTATLQTRLFNAAIQLDDFEAVATAVADLQHAADPRGRVVGRWGEAFLQVVLAPDTALATVTAAQQLASDLPESPDRIHLLGVYEVLHGWAHAVLGKHRQALDHFETAASLRATIDFEDESLLFIIQSMIASHIALGQLPEAKAAADLITYETVYITIDDCRLLTHLDDGDLTPVVPLIRAHALDGVTGRLSRKANDSLLFLAWLARNEEDLEHAHRLLLQARITRSPATIVLSLHLADLLGIRQEFETARRSGAADRYASGREAINDLAVELARRSWTNTSHDR